MYACELFSSLLSPSGLVCSAHFWTDVASYYIGHITSNLHKTNNLHVTLPLIFNYMINEFSLSHDSVGDAGIWIATLFT